MSLATVSIVGNLVRDPEQFSFPSGRTKTKIIVAVNVPSKSNKSAEEADFYRVEAWGKLGDLTANYLSKGNQVTVCGRLVFEKWTDKEGRERKTPLVEANHIAFPRKTKPADYDSSSSKGANSAPEDEMPNLDDVEEFDAAPATVTALESKTIDLPKGSTGGQKLRRA